MKLLSFFVWLLSTYCGVWRSARVACALCAMVWLLACTLQPTEHQLLCIRPLSSAVLSARMTLECFDALGIMMDPQFFFGDARCLPPRGSAN